MRGFISTILLVISAVSFSQEHSSARQWNEALLFGIRNDLARPTVHARNLFHTSIAMYDAWAIFDPSADTYFLGQTVGDFECPFNGFETNVSDSEAVDEILSFAVYRLLTHRFEASPGGFSTLNYFDSLMNEMNYDKTNVSLDYQSGDPAALGNYLGLQLIQFGKQDGSNEENNYANSDYEPINEPLAPTDPGNPNITDPNRWQPLSLEEFIDQSGNTVPGSVQPFLGAEWGKVVPFALKEEDKTIIEKEGKEFVVYHDPGDPSEVGENSSTNEDFIWGFSLVAAWSGHLSPSDNVMWDISPATIGNIQNLPKESSEYANFYDFENGGDASLGWETNPHTGEPYDVQMVPRGDFARVLAEFWADGPDSETPPGHWFSILNYVSDHPDFVRKFKGTGDIIPQLEWDVKAYFTLGGAVHDAAITAWGIKGFYDYTRPISAIRYMADKGQSSDPSLDNYHPEGIKLMPGVIELVETGDPLAGDTNENVNKIKIKCWKGPEFISDPEVDEAGVDWILAENWWPYQRPSFVTPPFAGYVSGHSTFSRAAAEVMTLITGDEFFPGGMGEFIAKKNEFLVFEEGPSVDVVLQWATYRDASDQTSLSRIWGGIHPPVDDIPGRIMGAKIGVEAFDLATRYFNGVISSADNYAINESSDLHIYPNPAFNAQFIVIDKLQDKKITSVELIDKNGKIVSTQDFEYVDSMIRLDVSEVRTGVYLIRVKTETETKTSRLIIIH